MMTAVYIISGILGLLILIRITLPYIAVRIANRKMNETAGIRGHIKSIGLNLLGGAITIRNLTIAKRDKMSGVETIIAKIEALQITIPLSKLVKKRFEGSMTIVNSDLLYAAVLEAPKVEKSKKQVPAPVAVSPIRTALEKAPIFNLNVEIINGKARYINHTSKSKMDVTVSAVNVKVNNFTNQQAITDTATIQASANVYGGRFSLDMTTKPMREQLTFDIKAELEEAELTQLNSYFRTFANIDVNGGTLGVYVEMTAEHGAFKGYLKPILKDIDVVGAEDSGDSIFKRVWERGVAALFQLLENNRTDQVATKIPFEGRLDDPHINIGAAISGVLRNAFIRAIRPSFETTFSLESVYKTTKGLFSRFFNREKE